MCWHPRPPVVKVECTDLKEIMVGFIFSKPNVNVNVNRLHLASATHCVETFPTRIYFRSVIFAQLQQLYIDAKKGRYFLSH